MSMDEILAKLDEVLAKSDIKFPRPISFANAEKLLLSISEEIRGKVHYSLNIPKSFVYDEEEKRIRISLKDRTLGHICIEDNKTHAFEFARMMPYEGDPSQFSSMKFDIVPRWKFSDYKKETLQLWDNVRKIVEKYFQDSQ
jgi:hypothetical protein